MKNYIDNERNVLVTTCAEHGRREWNNVELIAMKLYGYDGDFENAPPYVQEGVMAWFMKHFPEVCR